jgi:cytochrome b6-f complex iron-sulfur subunit
MRMTPRSDDGRKPEAASVPADPGRRRVLKWIWNILILAALAELVGLITAFIRPRRNAKSTGGSGLLVAGSVTDFTRGSVTAFPGGRFYLARLENGGFLAMHRECTHLGCAIPWSATDGRFTCPCHASSFDITGAVLQPPATRPLDLYVVRIENGIVKVDVGRTVRRTRFSPSQVVRA